MDSDKYIIELYSRYEGDNTAWYVTNLTRTDEIEFSCLAPTPMPMDVALEIREKLIESMINSKNYYFKTATIIPYDEYENDFIKHVSFCDFYTNGYNHYGK